MKIRPMKAATVEDKHLAMLKLPMFASVKYDGIRSMVRDQVALSSSLKPIRNKYVQSILSHPDLHGCDGELLINWDGEGQPPFNLVSSAIMSEKGTPDFVFNVFDLWNQTKPYTLTYIDIEDKISLLQKPIPQLRITEQVLCETLDDILRYEAWALEAGYEGIMLRSIHGRYKFGESTLNEQYLLKRKPFVDEECWITGFVEQLENTNEPTLDNLGKTKRSTHKEGMVGKNTLGKFIVQSKKWGQFYLGKGQMTHAMAQEIWNNQDKYLGKIAVFKYQNYGIKDKPRIAIFKAIRHPEDLTPDKLEAI